MQEILSQPIVAIVVLLGVLVFVHEFGHFIVGKLCGLGVEIFSIGFGPKLFGFRIGLTDYRVCVLPLGGYVKFAGGFRSETVPEAFRGMEMYRAPVWKRALTIAAGPAANLLLAIVAHTALGMAGISHSPAIVGEVRRGSVAEMGGLQSGDQITKIDDEEIRTWGDMQRLVGAAIEKEIQITALRQGQSISLNLTPGKVEAEDLFGRSKPQGRIGIGLGFLPATVTLLEKDSPAGSGGIATGDQIIWIKLGEDAPISVHFWHELLDHLHLAYERHLPEISLGVLPGESSQLGQKHRGEPGEGTVVRLNTRVWQSVDSKDLDESQLKVSLASALGLIDSQLTIAQVEPPASTSLRVNDRIVLWNGEKLLDLYDLYQRLSDNKQPTTLVTVIRDFQELEVEVTLKPVDLQKASGLEVGYSLPVLFWGNLVQPDPYVEVYEGPLQGLLYGIKTTLSQSALVAQSIWGLLSGEVPLKALGGPILIAKVAGDSAKMGWMAFVTSMALISINLAVINLFPIPVLDGGQLVMVGAEAVRRRPLSERAMENYQKIGFVMVMALVILATYNDLSRFWRAMLSGVADLF